ncbi:class I SAM-dependent methyltransferase, partial [Candidatus Pelagibacter sp.]|nr:class I SAM-dependent methyltransferase [Candidatus Pelagibacter sp.]
GKHPCADTFLKSKKKSKKLKKFPLVVGYCKCSHLSAIYPISGYMRYEKHDYSYTSDNSIVSRTHFKNIAYKIYKKNKLNQNSLIIEAGSNDGTFLNEMISLTNCKVLGVDPSKNITNIARKKNIKTITNYFNNKLSTIIKKKFGSADIIYGANVFNHVDDINDFLIASKKLLKDNGELILEVPDLSSLINSTGFDTIYHEHRHYFSESSIYSVLKKHDLYCYKIHKINYMSGSLRVFASKKKIKKKMKLKKISLKQFNLFKKNVHNIIRKIKDFVEKNQPVVGIGAATKGNTLLNCCELTDKDIRFIYDRSIHKINKFTPGSGIKIVKETNISNNYSAIILPWNITKYLIKKKYFKKINYTSIAKISRKLK